MNKEQFQRLEPFLHGKGARQRVILYLLADGFTIDDLMAITLAGLYALKLPVELQVARDVALEGYNKAEDSGKPAFRYPNGDPLPRTAYNVLLHACANKVLGLPMSQSLFRDYINTSRKGTK